MIFKRLAAAIAGLRGWRRACLACLAGALGALAMAPVNAFPALAISYPVAIWLLDGIAWSPTDDSLSGRRFSLRNLMSAAWLGWLFGFGYFLAGLWWIGSAFLVDADEFAWLMPFAVLLLPAGLACFTALGFGLARLLWSANASRVVSFALTLAATEWLRGHILTGFPWNLPGYALTSEIHLAQSLSLIGVYGLTLVTILLFSTPALLARSWRWPVLAIAVLIGMAGFGGWRLAENPTVFDDKVQLRLMQPNVPEGDKFNPSLRNEVLAQYLALSRRSAAGASDGMAKVTHLIWPEAVFPFFLSNDPEALQALGDLLKPNAVLLTGAVRAQESISEEGGFAYYNSLHVIDATGTIIGNYDKHNLVPFGEYLPFQSALEAMGLQQLTKQRGGFSSGPGMRTLDIPGAPPVGVLICYEAIFPGDVIDAAHRPAWLLNVTNDAWFGFTPGPYQHFVQVRSRAIEEGLPLVRAANNGITAVIDPVGRIVGSLPLGATGVLDSPLPQPLAPTLLEQAGNAIIAGLFLLATIVSMGGCWLGQRHGRRDARIDCKR